MELRHCQMNFMQITWEVQWLHQSEIDCIRIYPQHWNVAYDTDIIHFFRFFKIDKQGFCVCMDVRELFIDQ